MKLWVTAIVLTAFLSQGCQDQGPRRLQTKSPSLPRMAVVEADPTCDYVSTQCPYTINGVTVYAGSGWTPPPLINWYAFDRFNSYVTWSSSPYPEDGNYNEYSGATINSSDTFLAPGGVVVETSCDPRKHGCLLPIQPRDSAFLVRITTGRWFKSPSDLETQEQIDQCQEMETKLLSMIADTWNRPANDTTQGLFRGSNDPSLAGDMGMHGGAYFNGSAHLDAREWDSLYAADSLQWQPRLVTMLLHEAAHALGKMHSVDPNVSYAGYDYFKYVMVGDRRSCVWNYPL
jgi:hypothetical protein